MSIVDSELFYIRESEEEKKSQETESEYITEEIVEQFMTEERAREDTAEGEVDQELTKIVVVNRKTPA